MFSVFIKYAATTVADLPKCSKMLSTINKLWKARLTHSRLTVHEDCAPLALMIIIPLLGLENVGDPTDAAVQVAENIGVGCIVDWDWQG
jgi:hypothetical protein